MRSTFTEMKEQAVALYLAGGNPANIGKRFGYGSATVMAWVRAATNGDKRHRILQKPSDRLDAAFQARRTTPPADFAARYTAGERIDLLMQEYHCSATYLYGWIDLLGLPRRGKGWAHGMENMLKHKRFPAFGAPDWESSQPDMLTPRIERIQATIRAEAAAAGVDVGYMP